MKSISDFNAGLRLYFEGQLRAAQDLFRSVYDANKHDAPAKLFIERADFFLHHGLPEDWDGITQFETK